MRGVALVAAAVGGLVMVGFGIYWNPQAALVAGAGVALLLAVRYRLVPRTPPRWAPADEPPSSSRSVESQSASGDRTGVAGDQSFPASDPPAWTATGTGDPHGDLGSDAPIGDR